MKASRRRKVLARSLFAAVLVLTAGCGLVASESDSESHFLVSCDSTCPDGLSCVCGKCTKRCAADDPCRALASDARCYASGSRCGAEAAGSSCDMECVVDGGCAALGAGYRCDGGYCVADGGAVGAGTSTDDLTANGGGNMSESVGGTGGGGAEMTAPPECCPGVSLVWNGYQVSEVCGFAEVGPRPFGAPACSNVLGACNDPIRVDGADLSAALADNNVQAATAVAAITFGWHGGLLEGGPRHILIGNADVAIWGTDCSDGPGGEPAPPELNCIPIPSGAARLAKLLDTLALQQLTIGDCAPNPGCYRASNPSCTYSYVVANATCAPQSSCALSDPAANAFANAEDCVAACYNDPCKAGYVEDPTIVDSFCTAQVVHGTDTYCFLVTGEPEQAQQRACLCACQISGAPLEQCGRYDRDNAFHVTCEAR